MTRQAADYLQSLADLPHGGKLVLCGVEWEDYGNLLQDLGESSAFRINYSNERLEVMRPSTKHERFKGVINLLLLSICDELEMDVVSFGSFTMKSDLLRKGVEADNSFYIRHAGAVQCKDDVNLAFDPPPDLVIEIDLTHDSHDKLEIYATLGVPEIWRYDGSRASILRLVDGAYADAEFSLCFPFLSAHELAELIATLAPGTHQARREVRAWVRAHQPPVFTSE